MKDQMRRQVLAEIDAEKKAAVLAEKQAEAALEAKLAEEARIKAEKDAVVKAIEAKRKAREFSNLTEEEKEEVREIAGTYAEKFLKSLDEEDYKAFSENLASSLIKQITKENFSVMAKQIKKSKGEYERFHYMGELKNGIFATLIYKVEFEKESKEEKANDESLLRMVLGELDGKYQIWSFRID